jgi:hypothetical protein
MKRFLFVVLFAVIMWAGLDCPSWAGKAEFPTGSIFDVTPSEGYVSVTSYTVYDVGSSTQTGIQRFFQNNGTGNIAFKWGDTTNISTTGMIILPQGVYIEDRWFGHIYFQSVDTTNNMRYKKLTK